MCQNIVNLNEYSRVSSQEVAERFWYTCSSGIVVDSLSDLIGLERNCLDQDLLANLKFMRGDEGRFFKDEETGGGGVTLATSIEDVEANVKRMLNKRVTKQPNSGKR